MARLQKWTLTTDGIANMQNPVVFYGRVENFNFFSNVTVEDEMEPCTPGIVKDTGSSSQHTRRRYPGDATPSNVTGHKKKVLSGVSFRSGNALPGKTITFSTHPELYDGGAERRSFQYVGSYRDFHLWMQENASKDMIVHNHTGAARTICLQIANPTTLGAQGTDKVVVSR